MTCSPGESADADRIFNGAYDNATGMRGPDRDRAGDGARAEKPGRSIYFVFMTAEESGLLGSEYFIAHPPVPAAQIAANLNVDGLNYLGATKDMVLLGADRSTLGPMVEGDSRGARPHAGRRTRTPSAATSTAPTTSRSRRRASRRLSINEPREFTGPNAAALLKKQEDYNGTDYHQPSRRVRPVVGLHRRRRGSQGAGAAGLAGRRGARDAAV